MKLKALCWILLIFFGALCIVGIPQVFAAVDDEEDDHEEDSPGWFGSLRETFISAAKSLGNLNSLLKDVSAFVRNFLVKALVWLVGGIFDILLIPFLGLISKNFITSQTMMETPWVINLWRLLWFPSLALYPFAILYLAKRFIEGKALGPAGKILLLSFALNIFSLWITEFLITNINEAVYQVMEPHVKVLTQKIGGEEPGPPYSTNLIFKGLLGAKYSTGSDLINGSFSQYLLQGDTANTIPMVVIMSALICLGILVMFKWFVLRALQILSPFYFVKIALTGDMDAAAGLINMYARTQALSLISVMVWILCYQINSDPATANQYGGLSPDLMTGIILWSAVFGIYKFWARQTLQAIKYAGTLNGGRVIADYGAMIERVGNTVSSVANHFGRAGLTEKGISLKEHGQRAQEKGRGIQDGASRLDREYLDYNEPFAKGKGLSGFVPFKALGLSSSGELEKMNLQKKYRPEEIGEEHLDFLSYEELGKTYAITVPPDVQDKFKTFVETQQIKDIRCQNRDGRTIFMANDKGNLDRAYNYFLKNLYWEHKGRFVVIKDGYPVAFTNPPRHGTCMGQWKGTHKI